MAKKGFLFFLILSFLILPAGFSAVNNVKVSGDITAIGFGRDLSLGSTTGGTLDQENFAGSIIRLRVDTDLSDNVSAVIRLINERGWGAETAADTDIDLDLGYVELKNFLYQPLTLIVGRQNLRYGNALVVGDPDTNQTASDSSVAAIADLSFRKSFDAVRAIFDYSPYTLDLIYSKIAEGSTNVNDDVTLFGGNLAYQWSSFNGVTEVYFFAADNTPFDTTQRAEEQNKTYTAGAHIQFDPNDHLTLSAEGAYQFGDVFADTNGDATRDTFLKLRAWAAQVGGEYRFLDPRNSKIGVSYTYLSGDRKSNDNEWNQWDPMFEDQTPAEIMNILGANTNAHFIQVKGSTMPREDITLGFVYAKAILAENPESTTFVPLLGTGFTNAASSNTYVVDNNEKGFGDEIDAYAVYDYTEDVQFKLLGAWFIPGDFFNSANDSVAYSVRGGLTVNF